MNIPPRIDQRGVVMNMNLPTAAYPAAHKFRGIWKQVSGAETYAVKGLIQHPSEDDLYLMVRHSYAEQDIYTLPGGGYRPERESSKDALQREIKQEVRLPLLWLEVLEDDRLVVTGRHREHVSIIGAVALGTELHPNGEIDEAVWRPVGFEPEGDYYVSDIVVEAVDLLKRSSQQS